MAISKTNEQVQTPQSPQTPPQPQTNTSISSQDLNLLKNLQNEVSQVIYRLGQLQLDKYRLDEQEKQLKQKLSDIQNQEKTLAQNLTNKYGKGSINPETGEFIPLS